LLQTKLNRFFVFMMIYCHFSLFQRKAMFPLHI